MKITGAELKQFMDTGWPKPDDDWYWDHEEFEGDPVPDITYDTDALGSIQYQGREADPTRGEGYDLTAYIRRWRKERDCDVLSVVVSKSKTAEARTLLKALGATVT